MDDWNQKMWNSGFEWFNRPYNGRIQAWDVDQIYYQVGTQKFVIFRHFQKNEKLLDQGAHLREIKTTKGRWVLAFSEFSKDEMDKVAESFKIHLKQDKTFSLIRLFLPEAHAANGGHCLSRRDMMSEYRGVYGTMSGQSLMGCLSNVYSGAKNNLDGKVESVKNFGLTFSFDFVLKAFSGLMTFAKELPNHLRKAIDGAGQAWSWMKSASLEDQLPIVCSVMGNIGSEAITSFLTRGPAGVAGLAMKIGETLGKFTFVKKLVDLKTELLSKGKEYYESMKESLQNLMQGALTGKVSEAQVDEFTRGARAACRL